VNIRRSTFLRTCLGFGAVALLGPSLLMAVTVKECHVGPPTPESYKWNFSKETSGLFNEILQRADAVEQEAEQLQELQRNADLINYQDEASLLNQARDDINAMDATLCRLRAIKRVDPAWQRRAIDRITPKLYELSSYDEMAITYLNNHPGYLYDPEYNAEINQMQGRAALVYRIMRNTEEYGAARKEVRTLGQNLGIQRGS
jgi:hypothetical protein